MKTILLTGSNGFLGKIIYNELHNKCNLITLARTNANINTDLSESIPIIPRVDIIVHTLGKAHDVNHSNFSYFDYFKNNVTSTINLLEGFDGIRKDNSRIIFGILLCCVRNDTSSDSYSRQIRRLRKHKCVCSKCKRQ